MQFFSGQARRVASCGHFLTWYKLCAQLLTYAIISRMKKQCETDGRITTSMGHYETMYHRADMTMIRHESYKKQALRQTVWLIAWEVLLVVYLSDGCLLLCTMYLRPRPLAVYLRSVKFDKTRVIRSCNCYLQWVDIHRVETTEIRIGSESYGLPQLHCFLTRVWETCRHTYVSIYWVYILKVQSTRCDVSQFNYFCKTL